MFKSATNWIFTGGFFRLQADGCWKSWAAEITLLFPQQQNTGGRKKSHSPNPTFSSAQGASLPGTPAQQCSSCAEGTGAEKLSVYRGADAALNEPWLRGSCCSTPDCRCLSAPSECWPWRCVPTTGTRLTPGGTETDVEA